MRNKRLIIALLAAITFGLIAAVGGKQYLLSAQTFQSNFNDVVVANVEATDGGKALAAGNSRVLSARLNDARFFWDEDRKPGNFDAWLKKLEGVTFHAKLGTMAEHVDRIAALAREIAPLVGADADQAEHQLEKDRRRKHRQRDAAEHLELIRAVDRCRLVEDLRNILKA